jgi:hypothetical protein
VSTFGASFVMALGLYTEETTASMVFGGLICVAGVVGTPIGGLMIEAIQLEEEEEEEGDAETSVVERDSVAEGREKSKLLDALLFRLNLVLIPGVLLLYPTCVRDPNPAAEPSLKR